MNKITIIAIATAALAAYFVINKIAHKVVQEPVVKNPGNEGKHITQVFSRAKKYGM